MDWDICGLSFSQESNYYMGYGLECISYIDEWPDVIEEDALNEKCCMEVLRRLTKKADNEIEELEGDLFILKTQLEWAEKNKYEEWFDICCKGLEENIQRLQSRSSLKDERAQNGNSNGVQSHTSKEPVKRIHEMALLVNELQDKHEQETAEDLTKPSSFVIENHSADLDEQEQMDKNAIKSVKVEDEDLETPTTNNGISSIPYMKLQGQAKNYVIKSEIFTAHEPLLPMISGKAISHRFRDLSSQHKIDRKSKSKIQSYSSGVQKSSAALTGKKIYSTSSSKSKGTGKQMQNQVEGQKLNRKRASQTVSDDLSLKAFLKSQGEKRSCMIQKDPVEVKIPLVASTELLKLRGFTTEDTTKDGISNSLENEINRKLHTKPVDLNTFTVPQLRELAKSLGVTGFGEYRKGTLIELLAEILIE